MTRWAEYVKRLADGENQAAVAARLNVNQATVSRWLRGEKVPTDPAFVAHVAQVYGGNVLEAFVAAGWLTEDEAGVPPVPRADFGSLVDADPSLSAESKEHLKSQYGLLQAASAHKASLREEIAGNPNLDEATRRQLLVKLDEVEQASGTAVDPRGRTA